MYIKFRQLDVYESISIITLHWIKLQIRGGTQCNKQSVFLCVCVCVFSWPLLLLSWKLKCEAISV
jgi:hypothetical protein